MIISLGFSFLLTSIYIVYTQGIHCEKSLLKLHFDYASAGACVYLLNQYADHSNYTICIGVDTLYLFFIHHHQGSLFVIHSTQRFFESNSVTQISFSIELIVVGTKSRSDHLTKLERQKFSSLFHFNICYPLESISKFR